MTVLIIIIIDIYSLLSAYFITERFKSAYANLMCRLDWSSHDSMDNKCQRE